MKEIKLWAPSTRRWDRGYVRGLENAVLFIEQCKSVGPASQEVAQPEPTATPAPTQPSEVGPYKTVPSISCPGFYTLQENRINIFGPAKLRECHDYMAYARKGFALGQSTARSQEGRLREALGKIASLPHAPRCTYAAGKYSGAISKCNCGKGIAEQALTASPEAKLPELGIKIKATKQLMCRKFLVFAQLALVKLQLRKQAVCIYV